MHHNIPVVILCGGLGTRLREETEFKPKPMVEIGGKPILWHIMKHYAHFGFRRFILCLGYKGSVIKEYFLNYEAMSNDFTVNLGKGNQLSYESNHTEQDFNVTLVDTGLKTMTGGRVKRIEKFIDTETFMVTYGDGLANVNIDDLVAFHQRHGKLATLTATRPASTYILMNVPHSLSDFFQNLDVSFVSEPENAQSNYWLNAIVLKDRQKRDQFLEFGNQNGVQVRPVWTLMNHLPMYRNCQTTVIDNAQWLEDRMVNIPSSVRR